MLKFLWFTKIKETQRKQQLWAIISESRWPPQKKLEIMKWRKFVLAQIDIHNKITQYQQLQKAKHFLKLETGEC